MKRHQKLGVDVEIEGFRQLRCSGADAKEAQAPAATDRDGGGEEAGSDPEALSKEAMVEVNGQVEAKGSAMRRRVYHDRPRMTWSSQNDSPRPILKPIRV